MKSLSETVKDGEQRKRQLQEHIDQLNEECATLSAQGSFRTSLHSCQMYCVSLVIFAFSMLHCNRL